jgi:hypothetical protein
MNNTPQGRVEEKRERESEASKPEERGEEREGGQRRGFIIDRRGVQSLQLSESLLLRTWLCQGMDLKKVVRAEGLESSYQQPQSRNTSTCQAAC